MKKILIAIGLIALTGAGCSFSTNTNAPSSEIPPAVMAFDVPATFAIGESITFQDGVVFKLTAINDSRCPSGVQCIWTGELSSVFVYYGINGASQEFTLGTVRAGQVTIDNHVISLKNTTIDRTTITVSKK